MKTGALVSLSLLVLGAAVAFALWPSEPPPIPLPPAEPVIAPSLPREAPTPVRAEPVAPVTPVITTPTEPTVVAVLDAGPPKLDDAPDPEHLRELGLTEADVEPVNAAVTLRTADKQGMQAAVKEKMPALRSCYEAARARDAQTPSRINLELRLIEIPGRDRSKMLNFQTNAPQEFAACMAPLFAGERFTVPRGGEARIKVPVNFGRGTKGE